jgi:hypothetical protein
MNAMSGRWRRIAVKIVRHASWVLPGARSQWSDAMRRELDYIEDDRAALRWAIGCVVAGYAARLAALPRPRWRISWRPVVAGSMLLLVALALQGHASDQAGPSLPTLEEATCDPPDVSPDRRRTHRVPMEDHRSVSSQERRCLEPCSAAAPLCSPEGRGTVRGSR